MADSNNAVPPGATSAKRLRFLDYLGILFGLTTVVGFVLAYYWHAQSVQERAPTYYVSPERTRILDTSIPAPLQLQVLYKGKDLNANINAVIVYVWNDGKLAIKGEDVLEPLSIQLLPGAEILDTRVLRVSRAVTKFAKGEVSDAAKNSLPISFNILERGDGAALQVIYAGNPDAAVSLQGTILGVAELHNLSPTRIHANPPQRLSRKDGYLSFTFGTCFLFLSVVGSILMRFIPPATFPKRVPRWFLKFAFFPFSRVGVIYSVTIAVLLWVLGFQIIRSIPLEVPPSISIDRLTP
jgi:hypothetical protein